MHDLFIFSLSTREEMERWRESERKREGGGRKREKSEKDRSIKRRKPADRNTQTKKVRYGNVIKLQQCDLDRV